MFLNIFLLVTDENRRNVRSRVGGGHSNLRSRVHRVKFSLEAPPPTKDSEIEALSFHW